MYTGYILQLYTNDKYVHDHTYNFILMFLLIFIYLSIFTYTCKAHENRVQLCSVYRLPGPKSDLCPGADE